MALLIRLLKGYLALVLIVLLLGTTASAIVFGLRGRPEVPSPTPLSELFGRGPTPTADQAPFGPIYTKDEVLRSLASIDPCMLLQPHRDFKFRRTRPEGPHGCSALLGRQRVEVWMGTEPIPALGPRGTHVDIGGFSANRTSSAGICQLILNTVNHYEISLTATCRTIDRFGELVVKRLTRPGGPGQLHGQAILTACDLLRSTSSDVSASLFSKPRPTVSGLDYCLVHTPRGNDASVTVDYTSVSLTSRAKGTNSRIVRLAGQQVVVHSGGRWCFGNTNLWPAPVPEEYAEVSVAGETCPIVREMLKRVIHNSKRTPKPSPLQPIDILLPTGSSEQTE